MIFYDDDNVTQNENLEQEPEIVVEEVVEDDESTRLIIKNATVDGIKSGKLKTES